jgi:hypothetical protein
MARVQPLAATVVVVLGTLPWILASSLRPGDTDLEFYRPTQWAVMAAMVFTALGLGYRG